VYDGNMIDHFLALGYTNTDPGFEPHASKKHGFYKLQKDGELYFAKYSKDTSVRQSSIATDIWWCILMERLRREHALQVNTPLIVSSGESWYIARWIDGQPSIRPDSTDPPLDTYLPQYAAVLAELDSIKPEWVGTTPPPANNATPSTQLDRSWDTWSKEPLAEGLITPAELTAARALLADHQAYLTPQLQHGDFVPWHFLADTAGTLWLIDAEHASLHKPRFYDLAYMYSRIFTRFHDSYHASQLLTLFMQKRQLTPEVLYPALLPIITSRAIGMLFDALNDLHEIDYRRDAQELLARCLSRNPARLLES
jgi:aminoglycoside phosphotransferase (APT) family kinase protein